MRLYFKRKHELKLKRALGCGSSSTALKHEALHSNSIPPKKEKKRKGKFTDMNGKQLGGKNKIWL
jgi:hypothetical protein